jgi:hypothetical protein
MINSHQSQSIKSALYKLTMKWGNVCISCLFGDFNVYGSPLSNNIRFSIAQNNTK